jgi:hypothetical protein
MMKTDLFLKFTNKAEAEGVLTSIGAKIENGKIAPNASIYGFQASIDVLFGTGTIHSPTGQMQEVDGMSVPVMAAVPGYHVNVRIMGDYTPPELEPFMLDPEPTNPKCVFAG